ncbi:low temperature requirement protein A [Nocardia camponoti]|uniref:Low temperature requirement protein A n=1 Tax=Nocardia camponoti TaxID=1616106 RepID=A0A917VBU7_9NOCA|nr:low temperature requirement protein A [Nocardia camponoti]
MAEDASVTQIELFFDLVIVFAFTMVTDLAAHELTWLNMLRAFLVLGVMWWLWIAYSWLGNVVQADEGIVRLAMFAAMGFAFIAAIAIPEAFHDLPGGWNGPLVFALAYLGIRLLHMVMFLVISADDPQLRGQVVRWAPISIGIGTSLLVAAAMTHGTLQILLWIAAIGGDALWTKFAGADWRINSAKHFAERYGLIVIIALGESIVSIGIGVAGQPVSWPITVGSMLGLAVSGLLWWAYFDVTALSVEHAFAQATGKRKIRIAQNSYTYWHFPMIVGVIALSLGLKKVLNYASDESHYQLTDALKGIPLYGLYGGPVLFLVAIIGSKHYATGQITTARVVAVVALLALIPVAAMLPALAALGLLCAVLAALTIWEVARYAAPRDEIRHGH